MGLVDLTREARTGCLICGAELVYLPLQEQMTCVGCGLVHSSSARCAAGHFACDACHSGSAKDVIESFCQRSGERDPVVIATSLMRHPKLEMHGPEHHFLVPAALLTAYHNERGDRRKLAAQLAEARRRSEPLGGGFCGIQGACGAAIGTGIYVSIVTGSTPLSPAARGLANEMSSRALAIIAKSGGARCCKRDSALALLAAVRFTRERLGVAMRGHGPSCEFSGMNAECLRTGCPFFSGGKRHEPRSDEQART
jgi:Family of unknown function (DUF5714)